MLDVAIRLALAFVLALPLGWERERRSRSAGLRTYPLLAVCVCSFLLVGQSVPGEEREQADVFYGVLNGIGFVGTGAILKTSREARGLSTAVSLWVTGAIGAAAAYGAFLFAGALSLLSVAALWTPSIGRRRRGR